MKEKRKAVTVSLKVDLIREYLKFCNQEGMFLSRRLEILMEKDLKHNKGE